MANQSMIRSEDCSNNTCFTTFKISRSASRREVNLKFGLFVTDGVKLRTTDIINVTIALESIGMLTCML